MPPLTRISPLATKSTHVVSCLITRDLVERKATDAANNDRRREIHVFHEDDADTLHRMLNALQPDSYVRPHRHIAVAKAEAIIVLQGRVAFVPFDENGAIDEANAAILDPVRGVYGVDYRPGIWHTFFALAPNTVVFEVKPGPYDAATDKEFAAWAPTENDPGAATYFEGLRKEVMRICEG